MTAPQTTPKHSTVTIIYFAHSPQGSDSSSLLQRALVQAVQWGTTGSTFKVAHSRGWQVGAGWWSAGSQRGGWLGGGRCWVLVPLHMFAPTHGGWIPRLRPQDRMAFSCGSLGSHRASSPLSLAGRGCTRLDLALEEGPQALPLGQERGEGRPWGGKPHGRRLGRTGGKSERRRLVLCLGGFLRMRQAPFMVAPFPSEHCPLQLADPAPTSLHILRGAVPFPFASPARDLWPVLSNCSLYPREHTYFPLPKRRTWPSQAAARDKREARWPAFSHTGPRQRGAVCTLEKQQQLWGFFPMSYVQITALFHTSSETCRSFPGGPVVENPSCSAGEVGSIPDRGTKISGYGQ